MFYQEPKIIDIYPQISSVLSRGIKSEKLLIATQPTPTHAAESKPSRLISEQTLEMASLFGLILTMIAFIIALWQTRLAIKQNKDAKKQADRLEAIADALSTKYIGSFPEYITKIPAVLEDAASEIRILCSVPMHGIFNNPSAWLETKHAIERFISKQSGSRKLLCVFANKAERERLLKNQYRSLSNNWDEWISSPENHLRISDLMMKIKTKWANESISFETLMNCLEMAADEELNSTFRRAIIVEVDYPPPMFLWIVDNKQAIFVLKSTYPEFRAEAFWTSDARIIKSFIQIHDSYMESIVVGKALDKQP
jgi:hypothetical protein